MCFKIKVYEDNLLSNKTRHAWYKTIIYVHKTIHILYVIFEDKLILLFPNVLFKVYFIILIFLAKANQFWF